MKTTKLKNYMKQLLLCGLLAVVAGCGPNYSNGSRAGVVTKLSKKGMVWDSWEGELLMSLPADSGIVQPERFAFSIGPDDTTTVGKVQAALKSGKRVELVYRQWFKRPLTLDTKYVATDVR